MTGTIKKKTDRGFGFISVEGQEKDLFFHSSALVGVAFDSLSEGATVSFEVETAADGRQSAKNVTLADGAQSEALEESAPAEVAAPEEEVAAPTEESESTDTSAPAEEAPTEETK